MRTRVNPVQSTLNSNSFLPLLTTSASRGDVSGLVYFSGTSEFEACDAGLDICIVRISSGFNDLGSLGGVPYLVTVTFDLPAATPARPPRRQPELTQGIALPHGGRPLLGDKHDGRAG